MKTITDILLSEVGHNLSDKKGAVGVDLKQLNKELVPDLECLKRDLIWQCLVDSVSRHGKKPWARSCLQQAIRKAYLMKSKFTEDQAEELAEKLTSLKNSQMMNQLGEVSQSKWESGIRANPLSTVGNHVDAR
jgi:hypothetical protein